MSTSGTMRALATPEVVAYHQDRLLSHLRGVLEGASKTGRIRPLAGCD